MLSAWPAFKGHLNQCKETKILSVRQETEKSRVNTEVLAQKKTDK